MAGTREGCQQAAGTKQFEGEQVQVLVAAAGVIHPPLRRREFRRIEDDHVELPRLVAEGAQDLEGVAGEELGAVGNPVQFVVAAGQAQGLVGFVEIDHPGGGIGAADVHAEAARVGKCIEHFEGRAAARGEGGRKLAVDTLVEIEPRLLTVLEIDREHQALFADQAFSRGKLAIPDSAARLHSLLGAHLGVAPVENRAGLEDLGQGQNDLALATFCAERQELGDQHVGVGVHDDTRQQIGFPVEHAEGVGAGGIRVAEREARAVPQGHGRPDPAREEVTVDGLVLPGPDAGDDLRFGIVVAAAQPVALGGPDLHGLAVDGIFRARHGPGKDPGMSLFQRLVAAGLEMDCSCHRKQFQCSGVRKSPTCRTGQTCPTRSET